MASQSDQAATFFDGFAASFDTLYDGKRGGFMRWVDRNFRSDMFERFARTFAYCPDLTGCDVMDIGCGSGPYLLEAVRRGAAHVTGVDPAPGMLRLAETRLDGTDADHRYDLLLGAFPDIQLGSHDFAIIMGVFDYVADPLTFLEALRPLVRKAVLASFPSKHWFRTPIRKFRYRLRNCPVYFYDEQQIRKLSQRAGYHEVEIYKIPGAGMDYHVCLKP